MDIYRTVYQVEVFSRGPYYVAGDLELINYDITDGECIGWTTQVSSDVVPPNELEGHLLRIGNDGEFFGGEYYDDEDFEDPIPERVEGQEEPI